jgi:hypothetical protein
MVLSEVLTGKKPDYGVVFIEPELFKKIEDQAEQKGVSIDKEVADMLELAIKFYEAVFAVKDASEGGEVEL